MAYVINSSELAMPRRTRNLFEYEFCMDKISQKGDPLEKLNEIVPWEKLFLTPVSPAIVDEGVNRAKY